jgi:outer membrane protein assembly factor BamB
VSNINHCTRSFFIKTTHPPIMPKLRRLTHLVWIFPLVLAIFACQAGATTPQFDNLRWQYDLKDTFVQFSEPVVAEGAVYLAGQGSAEGHSGHLLALQESDGKLLWSAPFPSLSLTNPLVQGDVVLAIEGNGGQRTLLAVEKSTGAMRWRALEAMRGRAVLTDGLVWFCNSEDELVALHIADASEAYRLPIGDSDGSSLAVQGETVLLGDPDGRLVAFAAQDGTELWSTATEPRGYYEPAVIYNDELVIIDAPLMGVDLLTGKKRWQAWADTPEQLADGHQPILLNDTLYVRGYPDNDTLHALSAQTGIELWRKTIPDSQYFVGSDWLATYQNYVIAISSNDLTALDPSTGTQLWQYHLEREPKSGCLQEFKVGPAVLGAVIYANSAVTILENSCALDKNSAQVRISALDGSLLGVTVVPNTGFSRPALLFGVKTINNTLYQTAFGKIYAIAPAN